MKILALDASTQACSVALLLDNTVNERFEIAPREHAHLLLPMARDLLAEADLRLGDLDAIAVGQGPGAFTGIRIAMGMAQGLALGAGLPVAPISTLAALALRNYRLHAAPRTLVVQDARMQEVYWAGYVINATGQPCRHNEERVSPPQSLPITQFDSTWHGAGNGWGAYPEVLGTLAQRLGQTPQEILPHAEDIARLAATAVISGHAVPAAQAQPSYVRNEVAKKSAKRGL